MTSLRARLAARLARTLPLAAITAVTLATAACASDRLTGTAPVDLGAAAASTKIPGTGNGNGSGVLHGAPAPGNGVLRKTALTRTTALAAPITRSITLYRNGGTLRIPEAGLTLTIPRNAIGDERITITVTALAGRAVAYEFGPHGTQFRNNLTLTQELERTAWAGNAGRMVLGGGYFASTHQLNLAANFAFLNEVLPVTLTGNRVHMNINHFSGYMVSMD